jgi:hypothetical protein
MVRTSRCFVRNFFQLGGPHALVGVERFLCHLRFSNFLFARFSSTAKFFVASSDLESMNRCGSAANGQEGEEAARFVAA